MKINKKSIYLIISLVALITIGFILMKNENKVENIFSDDEEILTLLKSEHINKNYNSENGLKNILTLIKSDKSSILKEMSTTGRTIQSFTTDTFKNKTPEIKIIGTDGTSCYNSKNKNPS